MNIRQIVLGARNWAPNIQAFLHELTSKGFRNPFDPREIIINEEGGVELRPLYNGDLDTEEIHISAIRALFPGTGGGSRTLKVVIELADKHCVTLSGTAKPFGQDGLNQKRLVAWYKRYGFKNRSGEMVRNPKYHL